MLQYYLRMEPQLFQSAVDQQLQRLKEEKEAKEESVRKSQEEDSSSPQRSKSDLVLYQRMEEVRAARAVVHYMLWFCVSTHFLLRPAFTLQQKRQGLETSRFGCENEACGLFREVDSAHTCIWAGVEPNGCRGAREAF